MKIFYSSTIINLLVFVISSLLSFIFLELALSIFDIPPKMPMRYLFLSEPNIRNQISSFGFYPNIEVREASVHECNDKFCFEYDYIFQTNNIGLVQKSNIVQGKKSIILVGDSFTEGEGAVPWFYELEEGWQNDSYQLVNLGIMGTGVQQWLDTLQWFSNIAKITHIYMIFISGDWLRGRWYAESNSGLYFVPFEDSNQLSKKDRSTHIYFIDRLTDQQTILKEADQLKKSFLKQKSGIDYENLYVYRSIMNLRIWIGAIRRKTLGSEEIKVSDSDRKELIKSQESFNKIINIYGKRNITTIHIPMRKEVIDGKYDYFGRLIRDFLVSKQIPYYDGLKLCGLNKDDFYRHDGHPTASGYSKIRRLIENLLKDKITNESK